MNPLARQRLQAFLASLDEPRDTHVDCSGRERGSRMSGAREAPKRRREEQIRRLLELERPQEPEKEKKPRRGKPPRAVEVVGGPRFRSMQDAERAYGLPRASLSRSVAHGWRVRGMLFRYVEQKQEQEAA